MRIKPDNTDTLLGLVPDTEVELRDNSINVNLGKC